MSDMFSEPHIFVVFHPGSGGNFISTILKKIDSGNLNDTATTTSNGAAHNFVDLKVQGTDYMALGSHGIENDDFETPGDHVAYYHNKLKQHINQLYNGRQVIWSHDYRNIPLYRIIFPNSKILVITTDSLKEKLVSAMFNTYKNHITVGSVIPVDSTLQEKVELRIRTAMALRFRELIKQKKIPAMNREFLKHIVYNRRDYKDITEWFLYKTLLTTEYNLLWLIDDEIEKTNEPTLEYIRVRKYPFNKDNFDDPKNFEFRVICTYQDMINSTETVLLPYSAILNNDETTIVKKFQELLDRQLTEKEHQFVANALGKYLENQNQEMLVDPKGYYTKVKIKAEQSLLLLQDKLSKSD